MSTLPYHVGAQTVRGRVRAVVEWQAEGKRRRKFFASKDKARAWAEDRNAERGEVGTLFDSLTVAERGELVAVWHAARAAGTTLRAALDHWQATRPGSTITLGDAVAALLQAKRLANRRPAYIASLGIYLRAFARGREALPLAAVTVADVETWLAAADRPESRATRLGRLATLFAFAVRRGWLVASPCARIDRVVLDRRAPRILSVDQCAALLRWVQTHAPDCLPHLALALFAGVRPVELSRVTWVECDLDRALLTLDAAATKTRRRRLTDLAPVCVAWLRLGGALPLSAERWRYVRGQACAALGLPWSADVLRHTAASMMLARDGDAGKVAHQLGHSVAVLLTRYRELVPREAAAKFWQLSPESNPRPAATSGSAGTPAAAAPDVATSSPRRS